MPSIYFPNVPEYQPLIRAISAQRGVQRTEAGGYVAVTSSEEICVRRADTGLIEAVWFGALVGGFEGSVAKFDDRELRIA